MLHQKPIIISLKSHFTIQKLMIVECRLHKKNYAT